MRKLFVLLMVLAGLGATGPAAKAQTPLATPEAAVAAYVEAVAARDFDRLLAATAVAQMRDGFDFVAYVDRLGALMPTMPAPDGDPFFDDLNAVLFTDGIARQARFLAYGLLMPSSPLLEGKPVKMDGTEAAAFAAAADAGRLAGLRLEQVGLPSPELTQSERYIANSTRMAATYGADEATERVALVAFEGGHYAIGFMLLRYGDGWAVQAQHSPIAGMSALGTPVPASPEAFAELIR
jgi:hypothetical protein